MYIHTFFLFQSSRKAFALSLISYLFSLLDLMVEEASPLARIRLAFCALSFLAMASLTRFLISSGATREKQDIRYLIRIILDQTLL